MFGIPEKQAITLTPKAVAQILRLMEGKGHTGLRLGVKKGGCAGMEYTLEFEDDIDAGDEVVERDTHDRHHRKAAVLELLQPHLVGGSGVG